MLSVVAVIVENANKEERYPQLLLQVNVIFCDSGMMSLTSVLWRNNESVNRGSIG